MRVALIVLLAGWGSGVGFGLLAASPSSPPRLPAPNTLQLLERRAEYQRRQWQGASGSHDFRFRESPDAGGITFVHRFVDDAGRDYKPVQYDHGSGVAAADVDGDGRLDLYLTTQLGENQLWRGLGGGRFEEITRRAGVGMPGNGPFRRVPLRSGVLV